MSLITDLEEWFNSPEAQVELDRLAKEHKFLNERLTKNINSFHKKFGDRIDAVIEKYINKYDSDAYVRKEMSLGYEPREPMFWFIFEYAMVYGKPCKDTRYYNDFTGTAIYLGSYVIQIMHGQGSVIRIQKQKPHIKQPSEILLEYSMDELSNLLKELRKINAADKPSEVKLSKRMKPLYGSLKTQYKNWIDKHHVVSDAIKNEVVSRIENNLY